MFNKMEIDNIRKTLIEIAEKYSIKRAVLFGSRANGTNRDNSDIDLIIEFSKKVSLLTISNLKLELQSMLNLDVDIVHGPIQEDDLIEINEEVELYAA